ncbi:hypothetical protein V2G26_010968 [Clonostachys chloroleuca]
MGSLKSLFTLGALGVAAVTAAPEPKPKSPSCPAAGLPPYHPFVIEGGWDPVKVDVALRKDVNATLEAGYNVQIVWAGPGWPQEDFAKYLKGTKWDVTGIGFGMRASTIAEVVTLFEGEVFLFHQKTPNVPTVFNRGPDSLLWSVQRRFPLSSDCKGKPGKLIGYNELCDS